MTNKTPATPKVAAPALSSSASNPLVIYLANPPAASASMPITVIVQTPPNEIKWTEKAQAIGTPSVAFVAAIIAGVIAFRQWRTAEAAKDAARNKLKIELYKERLEIYKAAGEMALIIAEKGPTDYAKVMATAERMATARWLLNKKVSLHLQDMTGRATKRIADKPVVMPDDLTDGQKMG